MKEGVKVKGEKARKWIKSSNGATMFIDYG